jgi:hypothetical protein
LDAENFLNMIVKDKVRDRIVLKEDITIPGQSRRLVDVEFLLKEVAPGSYWIENEVDGVDSELRVTRGPYGLKSIKDPKMLFLENKTNETKTLKIGDVIGAIEKADFTDTKDDLEDNNTVKKKINEIKENIDDIFRDLGLDKIEGIKAKTRREIKRMVMRRVKVFSTKSLMFQTVQNKKTRVKHKVNTGEAGPIYQRPWRTPQIYQKAIREHIDEMLRVE